MVGTKGFAQHYRGFAVQIVGLELNPRSKP
jgi:hypothetical protein